MNLDSYQSDTLEHRVANGIDDNLEHVKDYIGEALVALRMYEVQSEVADLAQAVQVLNTATVLARKALTLAEVLAS